MANLLLTRLIISGGLVVLLIILLSIKTVAVVSYQEGEYIVESHKTFSIYNVKSTEVPSGLQQYFSWTAEEVIIGDFNNDRKQDIGIYLWKVGNYGDNLPFWEEENDDSYKQHLFLYENDGNEYPAIWHSSNLPYINVKTFLTDINGDGQNELVVLENPEGKVAVWKWDEWGFKNLWRSENGNFDDLLLK